MWSSFNRSAEYFQSVERNWLSNVSQIAKIRIEDALSDTRVVLISGPLQSGKTTLAMDIAADKTPFLTLDEATVLRSAIDDLVGLLIVAGSDQRFR